jgi:peptidoglycan hydrolase-like protein with peptidoglycan-binding domain
VTVLRMRPRSVGGRRRAIAWALVALVVVSGLAGWLAGRLIQSPAEVAARRSAPEPTPILVRAEQRSLSTDIVARGTARFGSPRKLALAETPLKTGRPVVTSVPERGTKLAEGEVALTVSGRPVIVLAGRQPGYRDLGPGMVGRDVRQLEAALARLGLGPLAVDGSFDASTESAVTRLYAQRGFEAMTATEEELAGVRPLEAELLDTARAQAGVQVPADEILFVPRTPVRVTELAVRPGDAPEGKVMTVTDVAVAVDSSLPVEEAPLVTPGMKVRIDEPDLGIEETGVVSHVAETPGTNGLDGFHVYVEVKVDGAPQELVGASLRLTIPIESTEGTVLAVPVTALSLAADGSSRVQKATPNGLEFVEVEPGLSAGGFVEVTPVSGSLVGGDRVVVGFAEAGGGGA